MSAKAITNVYRLFPEEACEWLLPVDPKDNDLLIFDGKPRSKNWQPVRMQRVKYDQAFLRPCDFPWGPGGGDLPMTQAARKKIGSHLETYGEFLPLQCDDGDFCTFHVTNFVDALDEHASDLLYAPDEPGYVLMINKHVFRPDKLTGDWMFKLPQGRGRGAFYVTDPFVQMIRASGLTGLHFHKVWPHP
jgi:hypothetical protein